MNEHTRIAPPKLDVEAVSAMIEASRIVPDPRNPRKFFDAAELQDLADSIIRVGGLLQPILIRPIDGDQFMIVFGERRWRAHRIAKGENAPIAVRICELTDEQVLYAQIDENDVRVATSETEDADFAARALEECGGDRLEAIGRLGWPASKFDRRIALNKLLPTVKTALNERKIKLGHAELLAAVPHDKQETALATIIASKIDVASTRDLLARMSHQLASATFDKTECATCPFNSTLQRTLFETSVDDGACTNPTCYQIKTEQAAAEKAALAAAQPPKPAPAPKAEKAPAAAKPDASKVVAPTAPAPGPDAAADSHASPSVHAAASPETATSSASDASDEDSSADDASTASVEPDTSAFAQARSACIRKARSLREGLWRRALAQHLAENSADAARVLLYAGYTGTLREVSRTTLPARADQLIAANFAEMAITAKIKVISDLDADALERARCAIAAAYAIDVPSFDHVEALAIACRVDIRHLWKVDKSFLDLHTKDELKLLALESGFTDAIGAKPFSRLAGGKREDMIAGMLNQPSFDWSGRLPSSMTLNGRYSAPL